jgi:hypothetical protein
MTITSDPVLRDPAIAARGRWLMLTVLLAGQFKALLEGSVRVHISTSEAVDTL